MKKKTKGMGLSYFGAYLSAIFGGMIPAMLFLKTVKGLAIFCVVLAVLAFGVTITGHVFERKNAFNSCERNEKLHLWFTVSGFGVISLLNLVGFFMELGLTIQKQPAPYAWMVTSLGIVIMAGVSVLYVLKIGKLHNRKYKGII